MLWTSALAIYFLIWSFCLFLVLPFHARTSDEAGESKVPGQADSAPSRFPAGKVALQVTAVSAVIFALYYINYETGFISADDINFFGSPDT